MPSTFTPSDVARRIVDEVLKAHQHSTEETRTKNIVERKKREAKWGSVNSIPDAFTAARRYESSGSLSPYDLSISLSLAVKYRNEAKNEDTKRLILFATSRIPGMTLSHPDRVSVLDSLLKLREPPHCIAPSLTLPKVRSFSSSDVTRLLETYSKHRLRERGASLLQEPLRASHSGRELASLIHCSVKLSANFVGNNFNNSLLRTGLQGCTFKDIALISWAYSKVKTAQDHQVWTMLMEQLAVECNPDVHLPILMWALGNARIRAPGFYNHVAYFARMYMDKPLDYANIVWGFACVGVYHESVFGVAPCESILSAATDKQLCNIIWSYGVAGRYPSVKLIDSHLYHRNKTDPLPPRLLAFTAMAAMKVSYNTSFALKVPLSKYDGKTLSGLAVEAYKQKNTSMIGKIAKALSTTSALNAFSRRELLSVRKIFTSPKLASRIARLLK
eukprot:TRINITY_DN11396_c0_g1_i1.p1 TRINITY_DN11396_c0_g1~~TRINITY_DN11396_c0_g1_i1.p1  ORF type:complete len:446 (+),score=60.54 TRINITY_DN11396_c0_g1_i1:138-1475(+)